MKRTVYIAKRDEYEIANILKGKCNTIMYERLPNDIDRISICGMETKHYWSIFKEISKMNIRSFVKRLCRS